MSKLAVIFLYKYSICNIIIEFILILYYIIYSADKDDIKKQVIYEQSNVKLSKMVDIKAEARKKVSLEKAKRLRALMNAKVETLHRFNNYGSVLKIVAEIDEAKKLDAAMRAEARAMHKKEQEAELLAAAERGPVLSPIIDLNTYMSPGRVAEGDYRDGPESDSDSDATSVVFQMNSPVTSPLAGHQKQHSQHVQNNQKPKQLGRSVSMNTVIQGTNNALVMKTPPPSGNGTGTGSRGSILVAPGSGSKRRGSQMGGSVVDDRTKMMALMRAKAEEIHREALLNKLMTTALLSRFGVMYKLISDKRIANAHQLAQQKLLRSVVWVQRWWYFVKIKIHMRRNPLSVERIRVVVLTGLRIRRLRKMHSGIGLMKEFLFSSIILKDMVAKIYRYRKRAVRVSTYEVSNLLSVLCIRYNVVYIYIFWYLYVLCVLLLCYISCLDYRFRSGLGVMCLYDRRGCWLYHCISLKSGTKTRRKSKKRVENKR